ncbi:MAG TPA: TorF family putative porin [Burkholderiaceae bacterium]|nr:TorF family putative porin [Burkholderiaceae bacterium]
MIKSVLFLAVASTLGAAARAEDPPASPFTGNIAVTTNYKYRGQDQGKLPSKTVRPAVQGGFDWSKDGWYLGNWNSSIGWTTDASVEMDFYGGYKGEIVKDLGYDVGILQYAYPGQASANVTELYGAISWSILTLKYSGTVSKDYFGWGKAFQDASPVPIGKPSGRGTGYLDLSANYEVVKALTLNAHVGYTRYSSDLRDQGLPSYTDYKLGATYDLGSGFTIAGAVVGATKKNYYGDINKARFIATLTKTL